MIFDEEQQKEMNDHLSKLNDAGLNIILKAMWRDNVLYGIQKTENLSLDDVIEKYGDALTTEQLEHLKNLIYSNEPK